MPGAIDVSKIPDAVPKDEPRSKYGNPASYVVNGRTYHVMKSGSGYIERGIASWYGEKFHGRRTSSGETYDMYGMTAAHKSLPLPSYVEVTNLQTGRKVVVKVNDRGPFHENRVIDLSWTAASKLGILGKGTGLVEVKTVGPGYKSAAPLIAAEPTGPRAPVAEATIQVSNTVSMPVNTPVSNFYIQVGAYSQLANAQRMYDKLGALGSDRLLLNETTVNGRQIYRVRIGPLDDVTLADQIVSRLGSLGIHEHQITTD